MSELSQELLGKARKQAENMGHALLTLEHLALVLVREDVDTRKLLAEYEIDAASVVESLAAYLNNAGKIKAGQIVEAFEPGVKEALTAADSRARDVYKDFTARGPQILHAILQRQTSAAAGIFRDLYNLDQALFTDILEDFEKKTGKAPQAPAQKNAPLAPYVKPPSQKPRNTFLIGEKKIPVTSKYSVNLNERAIKGRIDPVIGREEEIDRAIEILARRTKNNPVFLGDGGVGKTAIVEGLALRIVEGNVPDVLKDKNILTLDMASMIAGTKYRGQFEERIKGVIDELKEHKENTILFLDEIHTLIGAGGAEGAMDAANILKPALARGELNCIGATTVDEYRKHIEKDKALDRRFQKVMVEQPTPEQAKQILRGLRSRYESHHNVAFPDNIVDAIVDLSVRFISERVLPDKAIDVMDEVGARLNAHRAQEDKGRTLTVALENVEKVIASIARRPVGSVSSNDAAQLESLPENLRTRVKGQDEAIQIVADSVINGRVGLKDPNAPVGNFIFDGKTGVGKTELAKALAEELFGDENALIRIDMSEFMEKHSVSRLVGAPPGYVGYEEGGKLTEAVRRRPYSIVLLDEVEKAHPDTYNILLQVMSDGRLTDGQGRTVDFRNTILIMTTNAGARDKGRGPAGFDGDDDGSQGVSRAIAMKDSVPAAIRARFSPEFLNRVGAQNIVTFNDLKPQHMASIVDKFMAQVNGQLAEKNVTLALTGDARDYLAREGYDPDMGARPLGQLITNEIRTPLARQIAYGQLRNGGKVDVDVDKKENKLTFTFNAAVADTPANDNNVPAPAPLALSGPQPG